MFTREGVKLVKRILTKPHNTRLTQRYLTINNKKCIIRKKSFNICNVRKSLIRISERYYVFNDDNKDGVDEGEPRNISPGDLQNLRDMGVSNFLIIDVREENELKQSKLKGFDWINISKNVLLNLGTKEEFEELLNAPKFKKNLNDYDDIYFMCKRGVRSMTAANHIFELDLDQTLWNIDGGIDKYILDAPKGTQSN